MISVRWEKANSKPDFNQTRPPLHQIKVGTNLQLRAYFNVTSGPPGAAWTNNVVITRNGKAWSRGSVPCSTCKLDSKNPADTYEFYVRFKKPLQAGNYTATVTITFQNRSNRDSGSVSVVPKVAPPLPPVSFSFTNLQTVNGAGRPTSTFKPLTPVGVTYD